MASFYDIHARKNTLSGKKGNTEKFEKKGQHVVKVYEYLLHIKGINYLSI